MTKRAALLVIAAFALAACAQSGPSVHRGTPDSTQVNDTSNQVSMGSLYRSDTSSCVESYNPRAAVGLAFAFDGTIRSIGAARTNRAGKGYLDLVAVTFTVNEWFAGGTGASVTVDMTPPNDLSTVDEGRPSYQIGSRLLVSGEPRWGGEPLDDGIAWGCGFSRYYDPATASSWQAAASS